LPYTKYVKSAPFVFEPSESALDEPATYPPLPSLVLISDLFPWSVHVEASGTSSIPIVTIYDVPPTLHVTTYSNHTMRMDFLISGDTLIHIFCVLSKDRPYSRSQVERNATEKGCEENIFLNGEDETNGKTACHGEVGSSCRLDVAMLFCL